MTDSKKSESRAMQTINMMASATSGYVNVPGTHGIMSDPHVSGAVVADWTYRPSVTAGPQITYTPAVQIVEPIPSVTAAPSTVIIGGAPEYDSKKLRPEDQALVDYWIARHYHPPCGPSARELIDDFTARFIGATAKSMRTISVSKSWPGWMVDTLAVAWQKFRKQKGFNDHQLFKEHVGAELFLNNERPTLGTIETDYKVEKTEVLCETVAYCEPTQTAGFIVKADFTCNYGPPRIEILAHEQSRDSAQRFIDAFAKEAVACNLYKGKHLNVVGGRIKFTHIEAASFDQIIMNKKVIDLVRANTVELMDRRDQLRKFNVGTSHATILAGKPGTGKTLLGRAIATALGSRVTTWLVTSKAFWSAYDVTNFYEMVRAFGSAFVLFEDLDLVGRERSPNSTNEVLGELLNQMSGTALNEDILTIASTNDITALDAALADRPERIGTKIDVPLPGTEERRQMFEMFASKFNSKIDMSASAWSSILAGSDGFTGDYMRAVTRLAVRNVISEMKVEASAATKHLVVTETHLTDALAEILRSKAVGRKAAPTVSEHDGHFGEPARLGVGICLQCQARINLQNAERMGPPELTVKASEPEPEQSKGPALLAKRPGRVTVLKTRKITKM